MIMHKAVSKPLFWNVNDPRSIYKNKVANTKYFLSKCSPTPQPPKINKKIRIANYHKDLSNESHFRAGEIHDQMSEMSKFEGFISVYS